jgi:hypothetical protein
MKTNDASRFRLFVAAVANRYRIFLSVRLLKDEGLLTSFVRLTSFVCPSILSPTATTTMFDIAEHKVLDDF